MPRRPENVDEDFEPDPEGPDGSDLADDDDVDYVRCPHCGKPVPEDAEQCMHCRMYLSMEDEDAPVRPTKSPMWIVVTGVIVILGILLGWVMFF